MKYLMRDTYLAVRGAMLRAIFKKRKAAKLDRSDVTSIIAIRIDRIGDLVVSLPALKALKGIFPRARLSVMVRQANAPILRGSLFIDEVIFYEGFFKSIKMLREKKFTLAVDFLMDYTIKTALLCFYSDSALSAGFDIGGRGCLFTVSTQPSPEKKEMTKHLLDLARSIAKASGYDEKNIEDTDPVLYISEEAKAFAKDFFVSQGLGEGERLFGIHPGGYYPSQCWPAASFAELAQRVSKRYGAKVLVVGSSKDQDAVKLIVLSMEARPILAVGFSLDRLAAVIARTGIFICNNSGPLHIAVALGVKTVSTMGPTDPYLWHPGGVRAVVVRSEVSCSPCNRPSCRNHECMSNITVEMMEEAVSKLLHTDDHR